MGEEKVMEDVIWIEPVQGGTLIRTFFEEPVIVRAFNFLFYHRHPDRPVQSIIDYDTFFYPLDAITHWNRIYGPRGFTQYQFILPRASGRTGQGLAEWAAWLLDNRGLYGC